MQVVSCSLVKLAVILAGLDGRLAGWLDGKGPETRALAHAGGKPQLSQEPVVLMSVSEYVREAKECSCFLKEDVIDAVNVCFVASLAGTKRRLVVNMKFT